MANEYINFAEYKDYLNQLPEFSAQSSQHRLRSSWCAMLRSGTFEIRCYKCDATEKLKCTCRAFRQINGAQTLVLSWQNWEIKRTFFLGLSLDNLVKMIRPHFGQYFFDFAEYLRANDASE